MSEEKLNKSPVLGSKGTTSKRVAFLSTPVFTSNFNLLPVESQGFVTAHTKAPASTIVNVGRQSYLLVGTCEETNGFIAHAQLNHVSGSKKQRCTLSRVLLFRDENLKVTHVTSRLYNTMDSLQHLLLCSSVTLIFPSVR
jgi:hypothetical protein